MTNLDEIIDGSVVLTKQDQEEITWRLNDILNSLRAIRHMAIEGYDSNISEHLCTAIAEMARANIKGIDAVNGRLGGMVAGNFNTEFDRA